MNWWARLLRSGPELGTERNRALDAYRELPVSDLRCSLQAARCVVVDVETSGPRPLMDSLISIGAVVVSAGLIRFDQSFEVVLRQEAPSDHSNILVHGIGGTTQVSGKDPAEGLIDFLNFAGKAPLIGFHADFDRVVIARAVRKVLGLALDNVWLDVAVLAPALFYLGLKPFSAKNLSAPGWNGIGEAPANWFSKVM